MKFVDNNQTWVIFDTCTRPQYYQDVHNILALPDGAFMRYEYRRRHIATDAGELLNAAISVPARIIFMYVQPSGYVRGGTPPDSGIIPDYSQGIVVGTRLGYMVNIVQEGETVYFDFAVTGYPNPDRHSYDRILAPLAQSQDLPFCKWVTIANVDDTWRAILGGTTETNWEGIVAILDRAPSQFAGDIFWRIRRIAKDVSGESLHPTRRVETGARGSEEVCRVGYGYELKEDQKVTFGLVSYTSGISNPPNTELPWRLAVNTSDGCPMNVLGPNFLDLRPHSAEYLRLMANREGTVLDRHGVVSICSSLRENDYPVGPRLDFFFTVRKRLWEMIIGCLCLLAVVVFGLASAQLIKTKLVLGIALGLIAAMFLVLGTLIMTNRLPTKLR